MRKLMGITAALVLAVGGCDGDNRQSAQDDSNLSNSGNLDAGRTGDSETSGVPRDAGQNRTTQDSRAYDASVVLQDAEKTSGEADADNAIPDSAVEAADASDGDIEDGSGALPDGSIDEAVDANILQVIHPIWVEISQPFNAKDIALDEASAYVSYGIGYAGFIGGGLLQVDIQSGTSTTVLEARCNTGGSRATPPNTAVGNCSGDREGLVGSLALDATHLYFTSYRLETWAIPPFPTYGLVKIAKLGGEPVVLYESLDVDGFGHVAVDDTSVYWTTIRMNLGRYVWTVMKVAKEGGFAETLASGDYEISDITVDDTSVYWMNLDDRSIMKIDKSGGNPVPLVSEPVGTDDSLSPLINAAKMALDETYIYFGNWSDGAVRKADKVSGDPDTVALTIPTVPPNNDTVRSIFVDETNVYWLQVGRATRNFPVIYKVDKSGGAVTPLVSDRTINSEFIVNNDYIYWMTSNAVKRIER